MTIDEAKELEAYRRWVGTGDTLYGQRAWLARAAQPVRVSREALRTAVFNAQSENHNSMGVSFDVDALARALNIEVTDK